MVFVLPACLRIRLLPSRGQRDGWFFLELQIVLFCSALLGVTVTNLLCALLTGQRLLFAVEHRTELRNGVPEGGDAEMLSACSSIY